MISWYTLAFLSAIFFAIIIVLRKKVLQKERTMEYLLATFLLISLILIPFIGTIDTTTPFSTWVLILIKSIIITAALILATKSAKHMEISSRDPLSNLLPVFVVFLSIIFLGEVISMRQGFGIALVLLGAYVLEMKKHSFKVDIKKNKWLGYWILSLFLGAISAIFDKIIVSQTTIPTLMISQFLLITIALVAWDHLTTKSIKATWKEISRSFKIAGFLIPLISLLIIASEISYLAAVSIPGAFIALISVVRRTSSLMATIIGGELFHEHNLLHKIGSTIIMLVGVYFVVT